MKTHDFRSDTVTLPTAEMMDAIARAELGDAARGDDPTVNALEALCRQLTGKDDALFLPSGAMANLSAVIAHGGNGGEIIVGETSHIYNSEGGGLSVVAGGIARPVKSDNGIMDPSAIEQKITGQKSHAVAPTRLICLENTHNAAGGRAAPLENMAAIREVARRFDIPVHLDGARLFNAATYLGVTIDKLCSQVDSVWFALCKGLGCPVGAVLAGDAGFMQRARRAAKMLGGGMRQAGLLAAPALLALEDPYSVHERHHVLAARLARGLEDIDPSLVDADSVQTNIVNCFVDRFATDAAPIRRKLADAGVLTNARRTKIRFVTHGGVDETDVDAAIGAFEQTIAPYRKVA